LLRSDGLQRWLVLPDAAGQTSPRLLKLLDPALAVDGNLSRLWLGRATQNRVLCHPAGPQVLEATRDESGVFVVSLYGEGVALSELMQAGAFTPALAVYVCSTLLDVLQQAQSCDSALTHLDLDPAGILVRSDGSLLLPEFGLWGVLSPRELARRRFDAGRIAYASPELVQARSADTRSDVFSLGALLYELLSGEPAFAGATPLAVALAIDGGLRKPLAVVESLRDVVDTMLESEVEARFQSAAAARQALCSVAPYEPAAAQRELAQRVAAQTRSNRPESEPRTQLGLGLSALVRAAVSSVGEPAAALRLVPPSTTVPNLAAAAAEPPLSEARAPSAAPQYRYSPPHAAENGASSPSRRGIGHSSASRPLNSPPSPPLRSTPALGHPAAEAASLGENPFVASSAVAEPLTGPAPPPLLLPATPAPAAAANAREPRAPHSDAVHDGRTAFLRVEARAGTREPEPAARAGAREPEPAAREPVRARKLETALRTVLPRAWQHAFTGALAPAPESAQGKWRDPSATLFQLRRPASLAPLVRVSGQPLARWLAIALLLGPPLLAAVYLCCRLCF
jgi:serine/threonine protein kinase